MFVRLTLIFLLFSFSSLSAGWNEDFDAATVAISNDLPLLQNSQYQKDYQWFVGIRPALVKDKAVIRQLQKSDPQKKLMIIDKDLKIIIKKRRNNHIHDFYAWELSYLLGSNRYILPAFPVEIGGIRTIIQHLERFEFGDKLTGSYSKGTVETVSLQTYWEAHIQAFLLGFSDLAAANIGINSKGIIRFFDNEASLIYFNTPFRTELSFSTGFICQSFDWPQFSAPLDQATADSLRSMINNLSHLEEDLQIYTSDRPVEIPFERFQHRLELLRNFNFQEGVTFRDFYATVFPRLNAGLDELNRLVNKILKRDVGIGSTLFYATWKIRKNPPPSKQRAALERWIQTYID